MMGGDTKADDLKENEVGLKIVSGRTAEASKTLESETKR